MGIQVTIVCDADGCGNSVGPVGGFTSEFPSISQSARERAVRRAEQKDWDLTLGRIRSPDCKGETLMNAFRDAMNEALE